MLFANILLVSQTIIFRLLISIIEQRTLQPYLFVKIKDRQNKEDYHPVSILNGFYEIFINDSMFSIIQTFLSNFFSTYRKHYSRNHVLISLIRTRKKNLDNNKIIGAVLMDISKAFDCTPHDLLLAKMEVCGFNEDFLTFL